MKKLLLSLPFIFLGFSTSPLYALTIEDFSVKKSTLDDSTYSTSVSDVAVDSQITFQIQGGTDSGQRNFVLNLPAGFQYVGYTTESSCPIQSVTSTTNSNFSYSFDSNGAGFCVSDLRVTYKALNTAYNGNNTINLREGSTNILSVTVGVTNNISITQAKSIDRNKNGYIDAYNLTFSRNINDSSVNLNNIKVGGQSVTAFDTGTGANDTFAQIQFADNVFHTGETPQILDTVGGFVTDMLTITNGTVAESDTASPVIIQVNNSSLPGGNISLTNTGNISFTLSETPKATIINYVSLQKNSVTQTGSFSFSGKVLTFTGDSSFDAGVYGVAVNSLAQDLAGNTLESFGKNIAITLTRNVACINLPDNAEWNSVANISQTWDGTTAAPTNSGSYNTSASTTECRFVCKTNYTWNGSSCIADTKTFSCPAKVENSIWNSVDGFTQTWNGTAWSPVDSSTSYNQTASTTSCNFICESGYTWNGSACKKNSSSGGGGGGGGGGASTVPTCTTTQLECKNGIYYIKAGNICSGGDFGKSCLSQTEIWGDDILTIQNEISSGSTKVSFDALKQYNENKGNTYSLSGETTVFQGFGSEYFLLKNTTYQYQYSQALLALKKLIDTQENYNKNKTQENKTLLENAQKAYEETKALVKNPADSYVTFVDNIAQTTDTKIQKAMKKIETVLVSKYKKLLQNKVISQTQYGSTLESYNDFVLYLSIYRENKDTLAKEKVISSFTQLNNIYKKKVPKKIVSPTPTPISKKTINDVWKLSTEQKLKAYNDEVKNLQLILKHYGYFDYEATGYFGDTTNNLLKKFSEEQLNISYPGFLSKALIEKINALEY